MKIPLRPRAVAILRRLKELDGDSRCLFPAPTRSACLWAADVHGFRRTASTILHEKGYPPDWIELALAHKVGGIRGVYNGAAYLEQRREMLGGRLFGWVSEGWGAGGVTETAGISVISAGPVAHGCEHHVLPTASLS